MSTREDMFTTVLREHGKSDTGQRKALFSFLLDQEPLSMHELVEKASRAMDRASVYRIVALFEEIGIVRRINIGWKYKIELSDTFSEHHHHLSCIKCKRIIPINEQALESFIQTIAKTYTFQPTEHQVEIQGCCDMCQK